MGDNTKCFILLFSILGQTQMIFKNVKNKFALLDAYNHDYEALIKIRKTNIFIFLFIFFLYFLMFAVID